jgi:hypothetical protein
MNRDEQRFWAKVKKSDGCWEWTAFCYTKSGYGHFAISTDGTAKGWRSISAHRYSWILHFRLIPPHLCVLHRCDNRKCVRPDHLFLGTHMDNHIDAKSKGRLIYQTNPNWLKGKAGHYPNKFRKRGEEHHKAILNDSAVRYIRQNYKRGNGASLARKYGVSPNTVYGITSRRIWKELTDE